MKKLAMLVLAMVLMMTSLVACGKEEAKQNEGDKKVLTMGTNATFPPYEFYEGDDIVGIDAEIAAKIAEKLGMELKIEDMDFNSIITAVQTGKVDMGMAGMTVDPDRLKNVNFSVSYATGIQAIVVAEDSEIASADDLEGHMIGVQEGTTGHIYCSDDYGDENVTAYTTGANAIEALKTGKVDCVVIDNEPAKAFVAANEGLKVLDTEYTIEDYAIAVAKENEDLLKQIDEALTALIEDGTVKQIIDKYITAE